MHKNSIQTLIKTYYELEIMSLSPLNFVGFITFSSHEECLLPRRLSLDAGLKGEKGCNPKQKINLPYREEKSSKQYRLS